jgi:hypothetical protein
MTASTESAPALGNDLDRRRSKIRQRQLLLALEQWAPVYQRVAGGWLGYVAEITDATGEERTWLEQHVATNGMPAEHPTGEWHELRRTQGRQANAAASAAFLAGDYHRAHDLIDDALAYGAVLETEWRLLHKFISAKARAAEAEVSVPEPIPAIGAA